MGNKSCTQCPRSWFKPCLFSRYVVTSQTCQKAWGCSTILSCCSYYSDESRETLEMLLKQRKSLSQNYSIIRPQSHLFSLEQRQNTEEREEGGTWSCICMPNSPCIIIWLIITETSVSLFLIWYEFKKKTDPVHKRLLACCILPNQSWDFRARRHGQPDKNGMSLWQVTMFPFFSSAFIE